MPSRIKTRVAYGRYPALINLANDPIVAQKAPRPTDTYEVGQEWIDELHNHAWILTSYFGGLPTWTEIDSAGAIGGLPGNTIAVAGAVALVANNAYSLTGAGTYTPMLLPAVSDVGNQIWISTTNAASTGFVVTQGAGQQILDITALTTVGVAGNLTTVAGAGVQPYITLCLVCTVANLTWNVAFFRGNTIGLV